MTRRALLSALGLWAREPKAIVQANFLFTGCLGFLVWVLSRLPWPASGLLFAPLACAAFLLLLRVLRGLEEGRAAALPSARELGAALLDSAASALGFILAFAAFGLSAGLRFGPVLSALAVWLGIGSLLSLGLAAPQGQARWAALWAGLLAAVAFLPAAIIATLLGAWFSGAGALLMGSRHWAGALLWAPVILAPLFTPSFYAAYLYFLAQAIKDRSQGRPPLEGAPTFKEILRPWR